MSHYTRITANSYTISLGNTGARLSDPRARYYSVLKLLQQFKQTHKQWTPSEQLLLGDLLTQEGVFDIKKDNKVTADKDVRLKTSFLAQLGFTDYNRNITPVGEALLEKSQYPMIDDFEISSDSFLYLQQFLKYQQEGFLLKPLFSLLYSCIAFDNSLPIDFVTYIWASSHTEEELCSNIEYYKRHNSYKETVYLSVKNAASTQLAIENTETFAATHCFDDTIALKGLLYELLPHGKGSSFKEKAIELFYDLKLYWQHKDSWETSEKINYIQQVLKSRYKDISSKKPSFYLEVLFGQCTLIKKTDWDTVISFFEHTPLMESKNEKDFTVAYHVLYMYIKKLSICEEYRDLNIRHLRLLDIFIFANDTIELDIIFWYLFKSVKKFLLKETIITDQSSYRSFLEKEHASLGDIYKFLNINISDIIQDISIEEPQVKQIGLKGFTKKKKIERLEQLIHTVFSKKNILWLFDQLHKRDYEQVRLFIKGEYIEYEATIPALFEYLLAISFYWLTHKQIDLSQLLTPNLDANLLPKTHTAGGQADVILCLNNKDYLIEATLSDNDNQRKMEAEPVPRHLARHMLEVNTNSMALFVARELDPNNLVVLRNYKFSPWYGNHQDKVEGMNILPLTIRNIIFMLQEELPFINLEQQFESLLNSPTTDGYQWFIGEVNPKFDYDYK